LLQKQSEKLVAIIETGDSKAFARYTSILDVSNAANGTKLLRLMKIIGQENVLDLLIILISDAVSFFNLPEGKNMNSDQVVFAANAIIEDYPLFSLEDFALCFKNGKIGKYGKNYSAFDGQILFSWLKAYDLERDEVFVRQNKIETPKEPILPNLIVENLYEKFGLPIEESKKSKEEEFKKQKIDWLKQQQEKYKVVEETEKPTEPEPDAPQSDS
jgi:hypothetical protein